jgi:hypothetical protein
VGTFEILLSFNNRNFIPIVPLDGHDPPADKFKIITVRFFKLESITFRGKNSKISHSAQRLFDLIRENCFHYLKLEAI